MGGAGSPFGAAGARDARGHDLEVAIMLDFHEAVFGTEKDVAVTLDDSCSRCGGDGAEPGSSLKTCPTCKGRGQVTRVQQTILGSIQQTSTCSTCQGRGKSPEKPCTVCRGQGIERRSKTISVKIPAGVDNGTTIRLTGQGAAARGGGSKGDLYVQLRVRPDSRFERQGRDIHSRSTISMVDAALGTSVEIETVDGQVTLKVPAGTQSGKVFKLSGRGVPGLQGRSRGDHLVTVIAETPTKLSSKQRELLEQFASDGGKKGFFRK
jgi:molecular chaperone DnaJ